MPYKVGEYVTIKATGIIYENGELNKSKGLMRIQLSDGFKLRDLPEVVISPATENEIAEYQATAADGMTPDAIIDREAPYAVATEPDDDGDSDDDGDDEAVPA